MTAGAEGRPGGIGRRRRGAVWRARALVLALGLSLAATGPALVSPARAQDAGKEMEKAAEMASTGGVGAGDLAQVKAALETGIEAIKDLRRMARRGDAEAQVLLGDLHMEGRGVVRNYSLAGIWYEKAAEAGNEDAQFKLAGLYLRNQGRPFNVDKAKDWLRKAARYGHEASMEQLKTLGIEPPPVEARKAPPEASPNEKAKAKRSAERAVARIAKKLGTEVARLTVLDEVDEVLVVKVVGQTPPADKEAADPALVSLIEAYVAAVNGDDLDALKALMVPEYGQCKGSVPEDVYDKYLAEGLDYKILSGYALQAGAVDAGAPLPFVGMLAYPVRPGHYVRIEPKDKPLTKADGTRVFPTAAIVHAVNQDGLWSLVMGCPTAAEVARRQAKG